MKITMIIVMITKEKKIQLKLAPSYYLVKEVGRFDADGPAEKAVGLVAGNVDAFKREDVR